MILGFRSDPTLYLTIYMVRDMAMVGVNRADAKAHLDGVPVAQITSIDTPRKPINPAMLCAVTDRMSAQRQDAATFVRAMRDDERY